MSSGTVIALPFSGILAEKLGWESVFYVQGGLGAIWCVAWVFLVFDTPQDHPRIHPAERQLFDKMADSSTAKRQVQRSVLQDERKILTQPNVSLFFHNISGE